MRYTTYQPASKVEEADGHFYQRGQCCETIYNGQRFLKYLRGYKKGYPVWITLQMVPTAKQKRGLDKRPPVERNELMERRQHGEKSANGTAKRICESTPNAPLNYEMGRNAA